MIKWIAVSLLTCAFALATSADAQQQQKSRDARAQQYSKKHVSEMQVRHDCFLEAQARHPSTFGNDPEVMNERTAAYAACATDKGVRP